jgi:hypothetical protein
MDPAVRRAALIATAVTLPIFLIVALLLGHAADVGSKSSGNTGTNAALPAISVSPPPSNPAADAPCTALLGDLPTQISTSAGTLPGRPADSTSPYVVAWGNPAIVLRCGVPRPKALTVSSGALLILVDGVNFLPVRSGKVTVFTTVDRAAYVEVSVPTSYAQPPLGPIADGIAKAMKQVCTVPGENGVVSPPTLSLCTHRA